MLKLFVEKSFLLFMLIDNILRKRWNFSSNQIGSHRDTDLIEETDIDSPLASDIGISQRFHVSAQEWLTTWRSVE